MRTTGILQVPFLLVVLPMMVAGSGCPGINITIPDIPIPDIPIPDIPIPIDNAFSPRLQLQTYATNTNGAGGMALRPSDGAVFIVNDDGLFGPIAQGDDVSTMSPVGATNLADDGLFGGPSTSMVLAITNSGEFWIGSECCGILAVVPPEGGDAAPFTGLLEGSSPSNINPDTMAIVPSGFDGPQIDPGNLLVGEDTTFSRLTAIDVDGDRTVVNVDNPGDINREANHLAFGPDGVLYSSRNVLGLSLFGIQTVGTDGLPTPLPGTEGASAKSFVVRDNGDLIIRGEYDTSEIDLFTGLLMWSSADESITPALDLPTEELSEDDELVITDDGTILLTLQKRNEIVVVSDIP